jgi:hypothetical protein
MDWANEEIILSTSESIEHLITWIMMIYPLSNEEFNQVKRFRSLISESTSQRSLDMNCENPRPTNSGVIHDYLKHLRRSSESTFGESEKLRASLQLLFSAISTLQN